MMNKYILLGATRDDLDAVTKDVQNLLDIPFTEHESSYWGMYNLARLSDSERIKIGYNFVDGDWQQEEFQHCPLLIELNALEEPEKTMRFLCDHLTYLVPIHMKEIEGRRSRKYAFENGQPKLVDEYFLKRREKNKSSLFDHV